jgi:hypothetical protein
MNVVSVFGLLTGRYMVGAFWFSPILKIGPIPPRAQGLRLREVLPMQAISPWDDVAFSSTEIGTSELDPFIAVEMAIADHPPHRSERALLTHSAPTSSI